MGITSLVRDGRKLIINLYILKLLGWRINGQLPDTKKYIITVGPHTSNWDFVLGILARSALGAKVRFLGKHQLFKFPYAWLFRMLGGMPVNRTMDNELVEQVVTMFDNNDHFVLALAPEGTRRSTNRWRSGFYHIACIAKVDIVMVGLDYGSKQIVIEEALSPTGDIDVDFPKILDFYRGIKGRYPKKIPFHRPRAKI